MKFGLLFGMRNPEQWRKPYQQVYEETLEQIRIAESLGFDSVWMSEHHSAEDGYCPSTLVMAGAAAVQTEKITIGTRLLLLPMHHPVRVAEDAAVVDVLSNGRFILGMAVGYVPEEYPIFGVNRKNRPSLMDEGIEIIKRCWTEEKFDFKGKRFKVEGAAVQPKPIQAPHPPIWLGASRGKAIERVAREADGFHYVGGAGVYDQFASAMRKYGRDPASIPVFDSRDFWVSEDAEQGWEDAREHIFYSYSKYAEWGAAAAVADGANIDKRHEPATTPEEMRSMADLSGPFVGTPEQAVDFYRRRQAEVPISGTILRIPPGIDHEKVVKYLELLSAEVLPQLAED